MIEGRSKVLTMTGEAHNSYTDDTVERVAIAGAIARNFRECLSHSVALNAKIDRAC